MKRLSALFLAVVMAFSFASFAFADPGAVLSCSAAGDTLYPGDEWTVTVALSNCPKAKSVALVFDYDITDTFTPVGGEWLVSGALLSDFDRKTTACGTAATAYAAPADLNGNLFKLRLKVKESALPGEKTVSVSPVIKNDAAAIPCGNAVARVAVQSAGCTHAAKTAVEARASTALERGWDAYFRCDYCGRLFASDGTTELEEIPYRPSVTPASGAALSGAAAPSNVRPGEDVEITFSLANAPEAKSVALVFDYDIADTFTPVGGEWLVSGALLSDFDRKTTACGTAAAAYAAPADLNGNLFKLKLKVKESALPGEKTVSVTPVVKNDAAVIECAATSVILTVSEECRHTNKVRMEEKESTCKEQGWEAYYRCPDCEQLFASDGETEVGEVPFRPFQEHRGGEATCKSLAVCGVCGRPYGELDPDHHQGEAQTRNAIAPSYTAPGYTGDVYCGDCGAFIGRGSVIAALSMPGDLNGNKSVTMDDAILFLKILAELQTEEEADMLAADVNHDGSAAMDDAILILKYLAELIPSLD